VGFSFTTFVFELINFGVLVWLLNRLVFRPLSEGIEGRRVAATQRERDADAAIQRAEASRREYEDKLQALDQLQAKVHREAVEQAGVERARLLAQARDDAQAERARIDRLLEAEREASAAWVGEAVIAEALGLTGRLLIDLIPEEAHDVLLDRLREEVRERAESLRAEQEASGHAEVELQVARALTDEHEARLREELGSALGSAVRLSIRDAPDLLAGAVLRVGDTVLDASVGGALEVLQAKARSLLSEMPTP
jgi:F-type H+-transporting ATPase subunit b